MYFIKLLYINNMNIYKIFLFSIQIYLIINKIIKIPFQLVEERNFKGDFMKNIFLKKIVISFLIGSNKQQIFFTLKMSNYYTSITSINSNSLSKIYNESTSLTFQSFEEIKDLDSFHLGLKCKETFYIDNKTKLNNFPFYLVEITKFDSMYEYGILGLNLLYRFNFDRDFNFINNLKQNKIINDYTFYFNFDKKNLSKGELIIGENNINSQFENVYDNTLNINEFNYWELNIKNIYLNDILISNKKEIVDISIENPLIIGTMEKFEYLKKNFFDNEDCYNNEFYYLNYDYYSVNDELLLNYFYCKENVNISKFPNVTFNINNINFTFTYKDLFYNFNNSNYFLILFGTKKWHFGRLFLKKYQTAFNQEKKIIIFGMNEKKNNENINKNIIIFILFIIIILCIIVIIHLIYLIPKKKRANELKDENFEYFFDDKEKHLELNNGYKIIN